jgi:hypothetical protein
MPHLIVGFRIIAELLIEDQKCTKETRPAVDRSESTANPQVILRNSSRVAPENAAKLTAKTPWFIVTQEFRIGGTRFHPGCFARQTSLPGLLLTRRHFALE